MLIRIRLLPADGERSDVYTGGTAWRVTPGLGRQSGNSFLMIIVVGKLAPVQSSGATTTTTTDLETQNTGSNNSYSLDVRQKSTAVNFIIRAKETITP